MARDTVRRIIVSAADRTGGNLKKIAAQLNAMDAAIARSAKSTDFLARGFSRLGTITIAGLAVNQIVQTADSMQLLTNRLAVFADEGEDSVAIMRELGDAANRQLTDIEDLATIYTRLAASTQTLGLSTEQTLALSETLAQTFRISGSTSAEASAAVIQLSQALQSGSLQGQELRSVLEQNTALAVAFNQKFLGAAGSVNQVRESIFRFAERRGGFTATEVFQVLADNTELWNEQASKLTTTIGQGLNVASNILKVRMNELNDEFKITTSLAKAIIFVAENMDAVFAVALGAAARIYIPALIAQFNFLTLSMAASGGVLATIQAQMIAISVLSKTLIVPAVIAGITYALLNWEESLLLVQKAAVYVKIAFYEMLEGINSAAKSFGDFLSQYSLFEDSPAVIAAASTELGVYSEKADMARKELEGLNKEQEKLEKKSRENILKGLANGLDDSGRATNRLGEATANLNRQFLKDQDVDAYFRALDKEKLNQLHVEFQEGKKDLSSYSSELKKLELRQLNRDFQDTNMTVSQFNGKVRALEEADLRTQFEGGAISVNEFDKKIIAVSEKFEKDSALRSGVTQYLDSIGTLSQQVAGAINTSLGSLEESLFQFVKTGKLNFADFAQTVLDEMNRIIIRALILRPLLQGFGLDSTNKPQNTTVQQQALGGAWDKGVQYFAQGGVVNRTTLFGTSSGLGVMGEAGPEAIVPLKRDSSGSLGVGAVPANVMVNVINNAPDTETVQSERTDEKGAKIIDVMIISKVKEGFASGAFDKQMSAQYGLRRKGG